MQLFYSPAIEIPLHTLTEEESGHCVRVLRMAHGSELYLTDGAGNLHRATVEEPHPKRCTVRIVETFPAYGRRSYSLTVGIAPTKNADRYEWFLEKATEVGIDRIIPLECDHSERRTVKHDRSKKVVVSAMKQSQKAYLPVLEEMTPVRMVIGTPFEGKKLIAHCRPGVERRFIGNEVSPGDDVLLLIGPEGDFSESEVDAALAAGFIPVTLGDSRLRTETAAVAGVVMVSFVNNNI